MTRAWMLRQDGEAFQVKVHLYAMNDMDLSSEAEVASFLIATKSKDIQLAKQVLDGWIAFLIEDTVRDDSDETDIDNLITDALGKLPYKFPMELSVNEYLAIHRELDNFYDVDSYYDYIDSLTPAVSGLQTAIQDSLNQQFSRVRYGGQYANEGTTGMWCRVSSAGFNWSDVFYEFIVSQMNSLNIQTVSICRDPESDGADDDDIAYFYKAKDGTPYLNMPIDEYLSEEHGTNPVFSSTSIGLGYITSIRRQLQQGCTLNEIAANSDMCDTSDWDAAVSRIYSNIKFREIQNCVYSSEYFDNAPTRTKTRLQKLIRRIIQAYPEITDVDVDAEPYETFNNKRDGIRYMFELSSTIPKLNGLIVDVGFTKPDPTNDEIFRFFRRELHDYRQSLGI